VSYTLPNCPQGEKCEDILASDCVSYKGPNLPTLGILNNDRLLTILTKLHKVVNILKGVGAVGVQQYTATCTPPAGTTTPLVVTYLGLGPVYTSAAGATSIGSVVTVGSTTGLTLGMTVEVLSGTGAFVANTTVIGLTSNSFTVNTAPTTALSGGAVVRAYGSDHQVFTITVLPGTPQTFKAFISSHVILSGTGTIV
jgi:hypothetical protein